MYCLPIGVGTSSLLDAFEDFIKLATSIAEENAGLEDDDEYVTRVWGVVLSLRHDGAAQIQGYNVYPFRVIWWDVVGARGLSLCVCVCARARARARKLGC